MPTTDTTMPELRHEQQFISERDVARMLGVSLSLLRYWRRNGSGPASYKFGRHVKAAVRYSVPEVDAWAQQWRVSK